MDVVLREGVQERCDPRQRLGTWEYLTLQGGLSGCQFRMSKGQLSPGAEYFAGLMRISLRFWWHQPVNKSYVPQALDGLELGL